MIRTQEKHTATFLCLKEDVRGFEPRVSLFFSGILSVSDPALFVANKVLLHSALKTPGDFFDL